METAILNIIKKRPFVFVSYFNVLYFFEIINLMFLLLMIYGKVISVLSGIILSVLLSFHIINLYYKKEINRKMQLFMMDVHLAYSLPFLLITALNFYGSSVPDYLFVLVRSVIVCFDILFIYILSDYKEENAAI
ncbi:MAG: hypothetical protein V1874_17705 [Spirochaetota bacterium]